PTLAERSPESKPLVIASLPEINRQRAARGLPAVTTVILPVFKLGDLDNPQQLELDAIRGYNGYAGNGKGQFTVPVEGKQIARLHEFRVAADSKGRLITRTNQ